MQQAAPYVTPANQALRPESFLQQQAPAVAQAEAQPQLRLHEQQWRQVLGEPSWSLAFTH